MPSSYITTALGMTPKAAYSFDADVGAVVTDLGPNALNGAYINGAVGTAPALVYNGDRALQVAGNRYVTVPAGAWSKTSDFSISFVIQSYVTNNLVVMERNQNAGISVQINTSANVGGVAPNGHIGVTTMISGVARDAMASSISLGDGNPHHVTIVFAPNLAQWRIYVDGVNVTVFGVNTATNPTPTYGAAVATIGSRAGAVGFGGALDDIVFFDRTLTDVEARTLYDAYSGYKAPHRFWRLTSVAPYARADLELAALELGYEAERNDMGAVISSTIAPAFGSLDSLSDDNPLTSVRWAAATVRAAGFAIAFDLLTPKQIDGFRTAGVTKARALAYAETQFSDDQKTWVTLPNNYRQISYQGDGEFSEWLSEPGGDPSYNDTTLILLGEGVDGGVVFTDSSVAPKTPAVRAPVTTSTAFFRYGSAALFFAAGGARLTYAQSVDFGFGVGNFTVEAWVRVSNSTAVNSVFDNRTPAIQGNHFFIATGGIGASNNTAQIAAAGTIANNTWNHVAFVKNGTNLVGYINGVQVFSVVDNRTLGASNPAIIGGDFSDSRTQDFVGYMDELRVTKGVARYTGSFTPMPVVALGNGNVDVNYANVVSLLSFDGDNASTVIVDKATVPRTYNAVNGAALSTAQSRFGGSSVFFDGINDYLISPPITAFDLPGDFTIEAWIRPNTTVGLQVFFSRQDTGNNIAVQFRLNGPKLEAVLRPNGGASVLTITSVTSLTAGAWHHVAFTKQGVIARIFLDGTLEASGSQTGIYTSTTASLVLGVLIETGSPPVTPYAGYMDEFRFTVGIARYTTGFTAPTAPFPGPAGAGATENPTIFQSIAEPVAHARVPNLDPIRGRVVQTKLTARDVEYGGLGTIMGTVKEKGTTLDTPVRKKVRLFRDRDGAFIRETFSHPVTGEYRFDGIDANVNYSVVSYDNNANFRAVIADRVTPSIL